MNERELRLLRRLIKVCDGIEKQVHAIAEHASRYEKSQKPQPPAETQRVSVSPIEFSGKVTEKYYTEHNKDYALQRKTFWATVITGLIVFAYTTATYLQLDPINKSANAAKSAADTAAETLTQSKRSLVTEERPYLIVGIPVFTRDRGPSTPNPGVNIQFTDVGKTPAKDEENWSRFSVYRGARQDGTLIQFIEMELSQILRDTGRANDPGVVIYRQDIAPQQSSPYATRNLIGPYTSADATAVTLGNLVLVIVGFVRYRDSFNNPYQTDFCWYYFGTDPATWYFCPVHNVIN